MARKTKRQKNIPRASASDKKQTDSDRRDRSEKVHRPEHPRVSGRWLLSAVALSIAAAAFCAWVVLCLLFWQGSWQLLYHPTTAIARTPGSAGLAFDAIAFADSDAGVPRLKGWWIPAGPGAAFGRFTFVYLHGSDGNLGDTVDAMARLHAVGVNVLAFDYRGYGQSESARPSEAHWRQDAEWAIEYLIQTRHVDPAAIVLDGTGLGANLALEMAADHPELAGLVMDEPLATPEDAVFGDPRSKFLPARLLVRDRWEMDRPAASLRIPSLWFERTSLSGQAEQKIKPAYELVQARKERVWLTGSPDAARFYSLALIRWLGDLQAR